MHSIYFLRSCFFMLLAFLLTAVFSCKKQIIAPLNNKDTLPITGTMARADTLNIMAYNILNYGNGCQGYAADLDVNFKTIIQFTKPDILSCEKMNAFDTTPGIPGNLAEYITNDVLNASFTNQYAYAPPTNESNGKSMSVLFYNRQKLGYLSTVTLVKNSTDFDLYKLYYKDINLSIVRDTTFLYVVVNHTQSGSSSVNRDMQLTQEMTALRKMFSWFPNLINMGDFNTANSFEAGYQSIISTVDSTTQLSDPPYYPDNKLSYPGNWDNTPYAVSAYLTTSTRIDAGKPNICGTSGGAKSWFDHIFISPWLIKGSNYVKYIPFSYHTIGNDGNRLGVSVNSNFPIPNNAVPVEVAEALFQFSNKYPVFLKLAINANRNGSSPPDPVEK